MQPTISSAFRGPAEVSFVLIPAKKSETAKRTTPRT